MEPLHKAIRRIETEAGRLEPLLDLRRKRAIQDFLSTVNSVSHNLQRVLDLAAVRQDLIDEQCNTQTFHGPLHEKYHETNEHLGYDFENYFQSIEVSLNRFTTLLVELLPRAETRGIEHSGHTRFIKTVKKITPPTTQMTKIQELAGNTGTGIDLSISAYRDKKVIHVSDTFPVGFSSEPGSIKRVHSARKSESDGQPPSEPSDRSRIPPTILTKVPDGNYMYYLHVEMHPGMEDGVAVNVGQPMGTASDNNSGHFADYGPHGHVFASPNLTHDKVKSPRLTEQEHSPEPGDAALRVFSYFADVLGCINAPDTGRKG